MRIEFGFKKGNSFAWHPFPNSLEIDILVPDNSIMICLTEEIIGPLLYIPETECAYSLQSAIKIGIAKVIQGERK